MRDPLSEFMSGNTKKPLPVPYKVTPEAPSQNLGGFFKMFNELKGSSNPMGLFKIFASRNPQIQQVMEIVEQNGGDPKETFYKLCKEKNVDPETILKQLR